MRKVLTALAIAALLFSPTLTWAAGQPDEFNLAFERINAENGLPGQQVSSVFQDSYGYMWFGTESGLYRYDGYRFKSFSHRADDESSISYNVINCITESKAGLLWIGTGRGLNLFNPKTEKFIRFLNDPKNPQSLPENRVQALAEEKDGRFWVATLGGLALLDPKTGRFTVFTHRSDDPASLPNDQVRSLDRDKDGRLWAGTNEGLCRFDPEKRAFETFRHDPEDPESLSNNTVVALFADSAGVLWAGTQLGGLCRFDNKTKKFKGFRHDPGNPASISNDTISFIHEDRTGRLWVGARGGGLNHMDRAFGTFRRYSNDQAGPYSLTENSIISICEDRTGALWIGTMTDGVNKIDPNAIKFIPYRYNPAVTQGLGGNKMRGMFEDSSGMVWITSADGGLDRLDPKTGRFTNYGRRLASQGGVRAGMATSVLEDRTGTLWVGSWDAGLLILDREKGSFRQVPLDIRSGAPAGKELILFLHQDPRGDLWVGTFGSGLFRYDRSSGIFIRYGHDPMIPASLADDRLLAILSDTGGFLWVSVIGKGVDRFIPESGVFDHFEHRENDPGSIRANTIYSMHQDSSGIIWFGTVGGLDRYDPRTCRFSRPDSAEPALNGPIFGILEDNAGNLWFSGNSGLTCYNPKTGYFKTYDRRDGLQASAFAPLSYLKTRNGELYFGGNAGLNRFDPAAIRHNETAPPVVFTDFLLFHKSVGPGRDSVLSSPVGLTEKIVLSHGQSVFSIEFSALNYAVPEKNRFTYILEGYDSRWINTDSQNRLATYTNLHPGKYVFRVRGSNNDGMWNRNGASLSIVITPPWWGTWQFRLMIAILFCMFVYGGYKARVRAVESRNRTLAKKVGERTRDLVSVNTKLTLEIDNHTKTSQALDFERQQFLSIFDASNEIIYVSDPDTYEILYMNKTLRDVMGDAKGMICHRVFQNRETPCDFCTNHLIFGDNLGRSHTWEMLNPVAGRWYRCFDKAIRWPDGRMVRYEMAVDIHESKTAQDMLRLAKEKAEEASKEKSRFLANMSHEIRTPMTIIMGMTQLALESELDPSQRECLEPVLDSARSLLNLLNDILDMSKIEANKLELRQQDFSLPELLESTVKSFRVVADKKGLGLSYSIDRKIPAILSGDPYRLRQVLVNLLGNAVKFTAVGSIELSVRPAPVGGANGADPSQAPIETLSLLFSVRDTGIGIAPEKHEFIFNQFTQAEEFLTRRHSGTGLGLSISRKLVELMGGAIWIESAPGLGSTFFFTSRFTPGRETENRMPLTETRMQEGLDILVVEDNPVISQMICLFLARAGYRPSTAEDGEAALRFLEENRVELVLMDIQMPGMDGMETTRRLRMAQGWATPHDVPVIALTAHSLKGDRERFLEAGLDDYVAKPVDVPILMKTIAKVMKERLGEPGSQQFSEYADDRVLPAPGAILDREWLLERLGRNLDSLKKVTELFLKTVPARLEALNRAAETGSLEDLRRMAHSIKGLSMQMGASRTKDAAERLERAAEEGDSALAGRLHPALALALAELIDEIAAANE